MLNLLVVKLIQSSKCPTIVMSLKFNPARLLPRTNSAFKKYRSLHNIDYKRTVNGTKRALYVVSALHHCFLVFLFLADQIFYRLYVNQQHFRLRSFALLCLYCKRTNTYSWIGQFFILDAKPTGSLQ